MNKKRILSILCAVGILASITACSGASSTGSNSAASSGAASKKLDFPKDNITVIVPFAAGGGTDTMARIFAKAAGNKFFNGHSVIVENKGGGGGAIGQGYVAKQANTDGYTVLLYTSSVINNSILKNVNYSYKDLKPIIGCNPDPEIVAVPSNSKTKTLKDFLEKAKTKTMKVATPGFGSGHHIRALNMARLMNLKFSYIHNDSAAMQLSELMGHHCDASFMCASEVESTIKAGQAIGLGVMSENRVSSLPDVPTFKELGYDNWVDGAFRGFACSKDVPDDIYQYLVKEFTTVAKTDDYKAAMKKANMASELQTPEEYQKYIDSTAEAITALKPVLNVGNSSSK